MHLIMVSLEDREYSGDVMAFTFCITGLYEENSLVTFRFPLKGPVMWSIEVSLVSHEQIVEQTIEMPVVWDALKNDKKFKYIFCFHRRIQHHKGKEFELLLVTWSPHLFPGCHIEDGIRLYIDTWQD